MSAPNNNEQAPAEDGNAQRKRPAEAPPEDSQAEDTQQVKSTKEFQNLSQSPYTTAPHFHIITTPLSSVTSSRHQHHSQVP